MRRMLVLIAALALALALAPTGASSAAPPEGAGGARTVPGSYIVVLDAGDPGEVAGEHRRAHDARVTHVYRHALRGYAARMSERAAARVARDPRVAYVDLDRVVTTAHHQCAHQHARFGSGPCASLGGTVTDGDGPPIVGAEVTINGRSAITDANGVYAISDLDPGSYPVTVSADGYQSVSRTVSLVAGGNTEHFALSPAGTDPGPDPDPEPEPEPEPAYDVPLGLQRSFWDDGAVGRDYPAVAVIDTGIASHPDLNVAGGYNCSNGPPHRWSDGNGHGTHVAGTIGAFGGIVGVAPGAPLYAVRVLNNAGSGSWSDVICGINWVTQNASTVKVANMSLGGAGTAGGRCSSSSLRQAICNSVDAGVTYVAAAGNSSSDAAGFVPAAYPEVITVAALADFDGKPGGAGSPTCRNDVDDTVANFSNYGAAVDVIAPGVCITSTWRDGGYNTISGTSMAAPHVAGAAAMIRAAGGSPRTVLAGMAKTGYSPAYTTGGSPLPGAPWPLLVLDGL